jgi:hypothetical protein
MALMTPDLRRRDVSIDAGEVRRRFAAYRKMEADCHAAQVGPRLPLTPPGEAAPAAPKVHAGRSVIAVQDNHLSTHAAVVGPGLLCRTVADDVAHYTLVWDYDTSLIDCTSCLDALAAREEAVA